MGSTILIFLSLSVLSACLASEQVPREIAVKFPYFYNGVNENGSPVYLADFAKWPFGQVISSGDKIAIQNVHKLLEGFYKLMAKDGRESLGNGTIFIADAQGFDSSQFDGPEGMEFLAKQVKIFEQALSGPQLQTMYITNANKEYMAFFEKLKPSLGQIAEKTKIYGENVTEWCPDLLKLLGLDAETVKESAEPVSPLEALLERKFSDGFRSQYSYALSGYAASGAPVYIGATGNFAYDSTTKAGPESALEAERLMTQGVLRAMRAGLQVPGSPGAIIIGDMKGFREPEDPNVKKFIYRLYQTFDKAAAGPGLRKVFIVNANEDFRKVYNNARPLLQNTGHKWEVFYGNDIAFWQSVLRSEVGSPLPEELGGFREHVPLVVY